MPFSETPRGGQEHWGSISIDEMKPVFDEATNTLLLTTERFSETMRAGDTVTIGSNEKQEITGEGIVLEVDKDRKTIKVQLVK
jgi:hypothetical protein